MVPQHPVLCMYVYEDFCLKGVQLTVTEIIRVKMYMYFTCRYRYSDQGPAGYSLHEQRQTLQTYKQNVGTCTLHVYLHVPTCMYVTLQSQGCVNWRAYISHSCHGIR